ncbi:MAG: hypothetical protein ACPLKQ_02540 [Candidatus Bathyarchaeales archaeon]
MLKPNKKENRCVLHNILGSWYVKLLRDYLANRKLSEETPIHEASSIAVHAYFCKAAQNLLTSIEVIMENMV